MVDPGLRLTELHGEDGLVVAVLVRAFRDAKDDHEGATARADARRYFAGKEYRRHLQWLDLPEDWLPADFETNDATTKEPPLYWLTAGDETAQRWRAETPLNQWAATLNEYQDRRKTMSESFFVVDNATGYLVTNENGVQVKTAVDLARLSAGDLFKLSLLALNAMGASFDGLDIAAPADGAGDEDSQRVNWDAIKQALAENFDSADFEPADEPEANVARGVVVGELPMPTASEVQQHRQSQRDYGNEVPMPTAEQVDAHYRNVRPGDGDPVPEQIMTQSRRPPADAFEAPMPAPEGDE